MERGHRWPVVGLWFVATIGLLFVSLSMGGINAADAEREPQRAAARGERGLRRLQRRRDQRPVRAGRRRHRRRARRDRAIRRSQAAVGDLVAQLQAASAPLDGVQTPTFDQLTDPFSAPPEAGLVSPDGSTVRIVGRIEGDDDAGRAAARAGPADPRRRPGGQSRTSPIHAISSTFINDDINALISEGLDDSLRLTIPLTFIILLFAFGAIVASVVPLVLAITSLVAAFGILGIYSQVVGPVSPNATQLIVLIGLAVAVDYSLFMITRFRVERRAGRDRAKAIEVSSSTAGRAVFFSGLAVMISLAGLITLGVSLFTSMAIGTISVVFVSVVGSLTFLPATLSILGDRVNLGRPAAWLPRLAAALPIGPVRRWGRSALAWLDRRAAQQEGSGFWGRLVTWVMARPVPMTIAVGRAPAARSPRRSSSCGPGSPTSPPSPTRSTAWPASSCSTRNGRRAPTSSSRSWSPTPTGPRPRPPSSGSRPRASTIAGLHEPVEVTPSHDGKVAMVSFTMGGGQNDEANRAIVRQARTELDPGRLRRPARRPDAGHRRCRVLGRRDQGLRRRHPADLRRSCSGCRSC